MQELKERGAQIFTNPYVIQVDKFAGSLKKLSDTFSKLEDYRATFTNEENDDIFERVTQKVCRECENREKCLGGETAANVSYDAGNSVCGSGLRCRAKCGIKTQAYEAVPFGTEIFAGDTGKL